MLIIGHRGSSYEAPENTLAAFRLAWEERADGVELDVMLSADGAVVVHHDETLKRTAGLDRPVSECALKEIRKLDAGSWKDPRWRGERVPELSEVLADIPEGRRVFIEVKCGEEILAPLQKVVSDGGLQKEQVAFVGFSTPVMTLVKRAMPEHKVLLNIDTKRFPDDGVEGVMQAALDAGLDGLGLGYSKKVGVQLVQRCATRGLETFVWTVDRVKPAREMMDAGAQYLVTNRPGWMRRQLGFG